MLNLLSCSILLEIAKGLFFVLAVRGLLSDMALCVCARAFSSSYCESIFAVIEPEAVECIMVSACNLQ